ncbi:AAA family ATPase, partial [Candidatus Roizmanbacteria bacterium]|nr:AAA family ATPase [Candidatus Roizmanbacteria bacterium]
VALQDEIKYREQKGESEIRVSDGALTKIEAGEYIYSFVAEEVLIVTDDQPIEISYQGKRYSAILVGKQGNTVLVATPDSLGEKIGNAILIISPIFLLKALIAVLEQTPKLENYNFNFPDSIIGKKQLPDISIKKVDLGNSTIKLNFDQVNAIQAALGSRFCFIWGPPGTGKTTVIGKLVEYLLKEGKRVLITSHTNIAVDTALRDVLETDGKFNESVKEFYEDGKILRLGVHQLPALDDYPMIMGKNIASKNSQELLARLAEIDEEEAKLLTESKQIEDRLGTYRIITHYFEEKTTIEKEIATLSDNLAKQQAALKDNEDKKMLIKQQLEKSQKNNWFSNMMQGLNMGKLLDALNKTDNLIINTTSETQQIQEKIKDAKAELHTIDDEIEASGFDSSTINVSSELTAKLEENLTLINNIRTTKRSIQEQIDQITKLMLNSARVLATTLTKCYLRPEVLSQHFDVVIIDEISMAQVPHLFVVIGMGEKMILVGDFLQLPPISQAKTEMAKKWLSRSLYDYFEIPDRFIKKNDYINQVKPLFEQHRMHPDISNLINGFVYKGRLKDGEELKNERGQRGHLAPFDGHIGYFDTTSIEATCKRKEGGSRFTLKNAFIDLYLASITTQDYLRHYLKDRKIDEEEKISIVGVVSPYRAQASLLAKLLTDLMVNVDGEKYHLARFVEVNTVHRFQGNQRQVIIFDTTDDHPMFNPAPIVDDSEEGGEDIKLINVAVTRSKDKFLLLGSSDFINRKHSNSSLIKKILAMITERGKSLNYGYLLESSAANNVDISTFIDSKEINESIDSAESIVQLAISDLTGKKLYKEIREAVFRATKRGVSVEIITQLPNIYPQLFQTLAEETINQLKDIGAKCILRARQNDVFIICDNERVLCVFDEDNINGIQLKSKKGAKEIVRLYNIEDDEEAVPCPECLKHGRNGMIVPKTGRFGIFYSCSLYPTCKFVDKSRKQDKTERKVKELSSKCPECGRPLKKIRNRYGRFFWGCSGYPECKYILK